MVYSELGLPHWFLLGCWPAVCLPAAESSHLMTRLPPCKGELLRRSLCTFSGSFTLDLLSSRPPFPPTIIQKMSHKCPLLWGRGERVYSFHHIHKVIYYPPSHSKMCKPLLLVSLLLLRYGLCCHRDSSFLTSRSGSAGAVFPFDLCGCGRAALAAPLHSPDSPFVNPQAEGRTGLGSLPWLLVVRRHVAVSSRFPSLFFGFTERIITQLQCASHCSRQRGLH